MNVRTGNPHCQSFGFPVEAAAMAAADGDEGTVLADLRAGGRAYAFGRTALLKEKFFRLNLHVADGCGHRAPRDAAEEFSNLAIPFLKS